MRAGIDNPAVVQALNARFIEFENSLEDMYGVFAPQRRALGVFDFRSRKLDRVADERRDGAAYVVVSGHFPRAVEARAAGGLSTDHPRFI